MDQIIRANPRPKKISVIRGMRWPIEAIIDLLGSGMTFDQIIEDHPELEKEDILASLNFLKLYLSGKTINELA